MQSELHPSDHDHDTKPGPAGSAIVLAASSRLPQDSLIQDSLTDEDFNFGEKVTVNKNNYTLTYSGQGVIGSFIASMVSSAGAALEPQGVHFRNFQDLFEIFQNFRNFFQDF